MIDVLLAHSNHVFNDRKQAQKMQPYPPLETLIAASVLRGAGYSVGLCDVTLVEPEATFSEMLERLRPRLVLLCEDGFNFLSKMCLTRNRELSFWMANTAREHGITVAAHSPDASDHAAQYLAAGFDVVLLGSGEHYRRTRRGQTDGRDRRPGLQKQHRWNTALQPAPAAEH
jgi:hypothetical protein